MTFFLNRNPTTSRICEKFAGCASTTTPPLLNRTSSPSTICRDEEVTCHGSRRCCTDCHLVRRRFVAASPRRPRITISFRDVNEKWSLAVGVAVLVHVVFYVSLAVVRSVAANDVKKRRPTRRFSAWLPGSILVVSFLWVSVAFVVCLQHTLRSLAELRECHIRLLAFVSWNTVLGLMVLDYVSSIFPAVWRRRRQRREWQPIGPRSATAARSLGSRLTDWLGNLFLLWWVFVFVYLEGVRRGRWRLNF